MTTWDKTWSLSGVVFSDSDLTVGNDGSSVSEWAPARSVTSRNSGKKYVEIIAAQNDGANTGVIGLGEITMSNLDYVGSAADTWAMWGDGSVFNDGSDFAIGGAITDGEVARCAVDFDAGKAWFGEASGWVNGGDPATGATPTFTFAPNAEFYVVCSPYRDAPTADSLTVNFGASAFAHSVPSGFEAWDFVAPVVSDEITPAGGWERGKWERYQLPSDIRRQREVERQALEITEPEQRRLDRTAVKIARRFAKEGLSADRQAVLAAPAFDAVLAALEPNEGQALALANAILERIAWINAIAQADEEAALLALLAEI